MSNGAAMTAQQTQRPLCVDLDGTLIATDMLWESLISLAKKHPVDLMRVPFWYAAGGRSRLKHELAQRMNLDAATLPYRQQVLDFLRQQKETGQPILLTTASDAKLAQAVAAHVGLFDGVIGTTLQTNMKGKHKLDAIQARFPDGFDYIGDSSADLPLWKAATAAYLVAPSRGLLARVKSVCTPRQIFPAETLSLRSMIKLLRPHQWAKNALLALPMILAHDQNMLRQAKAVAIAFISFSLCASSVYIVNDILDVADDRAHPIKRKRPFASGKLQIKYGLLLLPLLLACSIIPAVWLLPKRFLVVLAVYWAASTAYSTYLKRLLLLDVFVLAGLYSLRVYAGGSASDNIVTPWLIAFSGFLFLSLAFAKRYAELVEAGERGVSNVSGRSYNDGDLSIVESVGPASGYMAVLVLALYINGLEEPRQIATAAPSLLYHHHHYLWLICPLLLYWITRLWFIAKRKCLYVDPVVFAIKDRISWYVLLVAAVIVWLSNLTPMPPF